MGKQGPCYHCGVTSTPLWRNGPPEKPILCNACGSRWRTKGTLINYTPLHARAEPIDPEYCKIYKVKSISIKTKEPKMHKRKQCNDDALVEFEAPDSVQDFCKVLDEDMSNRSSSGSAISYSESCTQFGNTDASDLTGSAQSNVWDTLVPSRKRTCINRPKPSSVEKLRQDLCSFLQEQQSSYLSGTSEEDLLFESTTPMESGEIGHGGVLIKYPHSSAHEEESEASSLTVDNKRVTVNEIYSGLAYLPLQVESKGTSIPTGKVKKVTGIGTQEHIKRDKFSHEKLHILQNSNSPLRFINLKDVVSFEEFTRHLTHEEQQQLMKYLPSTDTAKLPGSLKSVFDSPQFEEALSSFQQLLLEGIFDLSCPRTSTEECQSLKRLALANPTKSKWVEEHYKLLKDVKCKETTGENGIVAGSGFIGSGNMAPVKRPCEQSFQEPKGTVKSPKKAHKCGNTNLFSSITSPQPKCGDEGSKQSYETKDLFDSDGSCFSPRSLFTFQPDRSSVTLDYFNFTEDNSDQDLLFDVPSNGPFPQAELLHCHPWKQKVLPNGSLVESRAVEKEKTLSTQSLHGQRASASTRVVQYT